MPDSNFYNPFEKPSKNEWLQILDDAAQRQLTLSPKVKSPVFIHQDETKNYSPLAEKNNNNWNIVETISVANSKKANETALSSLQGGVDEVQFILRKLPEIDTLLNTIELSMIHTSFTLKDAGTTKMLRLMTQVHSFAKNTANLQGSFQLNPFSKTNRLKPRVKNYLQKGEQLFPNFKLLSLHQNKGLEIEQALAQIILQIERLFLTTKNQKSISEKIQIQLIAGQNILATISTIRAFKILWYQLLNKHGIENLPPDISITLDDSNWHEDVNQNRILATTQAMAAVIGGCNHLSIPFTEKNKKDTAFSARIKRNIQHIMKMESNMDRVIDPAAGSKIVEALTDAITNAAWEIATK